MPKAAFHTLGCKLNFAETSTLERQFIDRGFELVPFGESADVCLINTCSVTERANRECRQVIRRALRSSRAPFVIVTGCYAQLEPEDVASIPGVDLILGAREKFRIFDLAPSFEKVRYPRVCVSPIREADDFGPAFSTSASDRTRAFLKIQDGCDYQCSFCTIPLARGVSRSQPVGITLEQARTLVGQGFKEIVLTGVNVGDYGKKVGSNLLRLIKDLTRVEGLERIRISSIEPNLLSDEIIEFVAMSPNMCRHFHIPLQSGDDEVLGLMRRRYTTKQYRSLIERVRERIPDCGIGVDVIAGFPGETETHFQKTYSFLNDLPVSYLHVFTYSERPDTPAASFDDVVEPRMRFRRNEMLRMLGQKKKHAFHVSMLGSVADVLLESDVHDGYRTGFTGNYIRVKVPVTAADENTIVRARLISSGEDMCMAEVLEGNAAA